MKKTATLFLILVFTAIIQLSSYSQVSERMDSIYHNKEANLAPFTFNINLLDIALYGPIIQAEFKVANRSYIVPWIRYCYAGIASHYEWTYQRGNFEDDSKYDPTSIAIAAGYKKFFPGDKNRHLIYWGAFGEFIHEKGLHDMDVPGYEYEQTRLAVAVYGNVGYRWRSKRNFYLNLGILPGFAYDLKNEGIFSESEGIKTEVVKKNRFIGMIDFAFGWNFEN